MSYETMDHAAWMESQHAGTRRLAETSKVFARRAAKLPAQLSPFQRRVVNIMGIVGGGIYNAPVTSWNWDYGFGGVSVLWKRDLSTFDFDQLTMLVFLCHEARIRLDVAPAGPKMLRLSFWQRKAEGSMTQRHPNLAEAVEAFRKRIPVDHQIYLSEPV